MSVFRSGARSAETEEVTDRVLTLPNLLSLVRLALVPLVYVDIVAGRDLRALIVLAVITSSDWVDGYVARRFGQVSRIGQVFDPLSDRILVVVVGAALVVADIVPLWAVLAIVGRDALVLVAGVLLVVRGMRPPPVTDLGKAATFGVMGSLPTFLVERATGAITLRGTAWVLLATFGLLYYVAVGQYVVSLRETLRSRAEAPEAQQRRRAGDGGGSDPPA
ncbi:MAG TPA: CDP-alcohol phosphatidyltransferase family protein [Nitriliruptorales bacterium]|nr:CDP-alcohol phosphatidyltransferase family protein [Nitriliruptorales bacterium]